MLETIIIVKTLHKKPLKILNYDLRNDIIILLEKCENLFNSVNNKNKVENNIYTKNWFQRMGFSSFQGL